MSSASPAPPPACGLHRGIAHEAYLAWDAASSSRLHQLARSAAHLKASLEQPLDTDALRLGRAAHAAILEPEVFESAYKRGPDGDGRSKAVKDAKAALAEEFPDALILTPKDFDACRFMRDAVNQHREARALLDGATAREISAVWRDPATGVLCRIRPDLLLPTLIGDLKTTTDASPEGFRRSLHTFGYARQAAFYLRGMAMMDHLLDEFRILAVEKEAPYAVAVYRVGPASLAHANAEIDGLLEVYGACQREGVYPGYPEEVQELEMPTWALAA